MRLDVRGMVCPQPTAIVRRCLAELEPGDELEVIGDDPAAKRSIRRSCIRHGFAIREGTLAGDAASEESAGDAAREEPAGDAAREESAGDESVTGGEPTAGDEATAGDGPDTFRLHIRATEEATTGAGTAEE